MDYCAKSKSKWLTDPQFFTTQASISKLNIAYLDSEAQQSNGFNTKYKHTFLCNFLNGVLCKRQLKMVER